MGQIQTSEVSLPGESKAADDLYGSESDTEDTKSSSRIASPASRLESPSDETTFFDRRRTFRAKKKLKKGTKLGKLYESMKISMKATLGRGGDLRKTVKLPEGEDLNEWFAVNTLHFYNASSMLYATCVEFCTQETCPMMSAGPRYEYLWMDGTKIKKPTQVSAPEYVALMLEWVDEQISNPELFPSDEEGSFPRNFKNIIKTIYKRLFRLYSHLYYTHFERIQKIGAEAHLNTCFKHFIFFVHEFDLIDKKELAPLKRLIDKLFPEEASPEE